LHITFTRSPYRVFVCDFDILTVLDCDSVDEMTDDIVLLNEGRLIKILTVFFEILSE